MNRPSPITLRLDPALRDWITQAAQRNERSINGEIRYRLEQARITEQRKARRSTQGGRKHG